jgi:hypothetical protein
VKETYVNLGHDGRQCAQNCLLHEVDTSGDNVTGVNEVTQEAHETRQKWHTWLELVEVSREEQDAEMTQRSFHLLDV